MWYEDHDASAGFPLNVSCVELEKKDEISVGNYSGFARVYKLLRELTIPLP